MAIPEKNRDEPAAEFNVIIDGAIVTEVIDRDGCAAARLAETLIRQHLPSAAFAQRLFAYTPPEQLANLDAAKQQLEERLNAIAADLRNFAGV